MSKNSDSLLSQFEAAMQLCRRLYVGSAKLCAANYPTLIEPKDPAAYVELMDDLHRGLLIKVYVTIARADQRWTTPEKKLAQRLIVHVWKRDLWGTALREACRRMFEDSDDLSWYSVVRPFDTVYPLRERVGQLQTIIMRLANLVAKCDGEINEDKRRALKQLQDELNRIFGDDGLLNINRDSSQVERGRRVMESMSDNVQQLPNDSAGSQQKAGDKRKQTRERQAKRVRVGERKAAEDQAAADSQPKPTLEEALAELDRLIGLEQVKREVRSLTNYIQMQQQREAHGLPTNELSLHLVFAGNPGTGKTTVARIIGSILGAMGILEKGHLVETDRSGLVAEYAGQTGPKTNQKIDEALDGVLFIDEAYSLASKGPEDSYGQEAIQALLKRMEDDRHRLIVILAGYPEPMRELIASNPGLRSRFNHHWTFADYGPPDLAQIFELLCGASSYELPAATRWRLLHGFDWLYRERDEHFGNGRLVRNTFEHSIRRLANRIVGVAPLTREHLTVLQEADLEFKQVPSSTFDTGAGPWHWKCAHCQQRHPLIREQLGTTQSCSKCGRPTELAWTTLESAE